MDKLIYQEETYRILGACFEVYRDKGSGFLESVFHECLEIEFGLQDIPARVQIPLKLRYKGRELKQHYLADFVCFEKIVVELRQSQN